MYVRGEKLMEVKSLNYEKENKIRYKIIGSKKTQSYRTTENKVLKKFIDNFYYERVLSIHENDFLAYLKFLSLIENEAIITPDIAYVGQGNVVSSYVRDFVWGDSLKDLYPKTDIKGLERAIERFYIKISELSNLKLNGISARNIVYTGTDLFLTDFDLSVINEEDNKDANLKCLDSAIFEGLFDVYPFNIAYFSDSKVEELINELSAGSVNILEYLTEYKNILNNRGENTRYLKSLKNGVIISK